MPRLVLSKKEENLNEYEINGALKRGHLALISGKKGKEKLYFIAYAIAGCAFVETLKGNDIPFKIEDMKTIKFLDDKDFFLMMQENTKTICKLRKAAKKLRNVNKEDSY
jgi:hypothetical protein